MSSAAVCTDACRRQTGWQKTSRALGGAVPGAASSPLGLWKPPPLRTCLYPGPARGPSRQRAGGVTHEASPAQWFPGRRSTVQTSVQAHVVGTRHTPPWGLSLCTEPSHFTRAPGQGDQLLKPMGFFDPGGGLGLSSDWPFKHPSLSPRRVHSWGGAGRGPAGNAGFRGHPLPTPPRFFSAVPWPKLTYLGLRSPHRQNAV